MRTNTQAMINPKTALIEVAISADTNVTRYAAIARGEKPTAIKCSKPPPALRITTAHSGITTIKASQNRVIPMLRPKPGSAERRMPRLR